MHPKTSLAAAPSPSCFGCQFCSTASRKSPMDSSDVVPTTHETCELKGLDFRVLFCLGESHTPRTYHQNFFRLCASIYSISVTHLDEQGLIRYGLDMFLHFGAKEFEQNLFRREPQRVCCLGGVRQPGILLESSHAKVGARVAALLQKPWRTAENPDQGNPKR